MLGGGLNWFYRTLAGVNADENEPGYKHIIIRPLLSEVNDVYYSNMTPYGKVISEIHNQSGSITMNVTIPVGSHATVYIPVKGSQSVVRENKADINSVPYIKIIGNEGNYFVVNIQQGTYHFTVQ